MRLKSKLFAGVGSLALVGAMVAMAAPAAQAAVTVIGGCGGQVNLVKLNPGLTDQTQVGVKVTGNLAKDQTTKTPIGGSCSAPARTGDSHIPQPTGAVNPISDGFSLLGNASCASGPDVALDATAAEAWPLNGKITYTMSQTYTDLISLTVKKYKLQADIAVLGFHVVDAGNAGDIVDLGGIVLTGLAPGATVSGSIWEDPVAKTGGATGYNTGYELDLGSAAKCADGVAGDVNPAITLVLSGGGNTSLLGSTDATGPVFSLGE